MEIFIFIFTSIILVTVCLAYRKKINFLVFCLLPLVLVELYFCLVTVPSSDQISVEQAYFIGQRGVLTGEVSIQLNNDSCYVWIKSPWKNRVKPEFIPLTSSNNSTISDLCFSPSEKEKEEQAYFIGQRDALNGDVRIKLINDSCYVWTKSPWPDERTPKFKPTQLDTKINKL